jgi:hypothetical protein
MRASDADVLVVTRRYSGRSKRKQNSMQYLDVYAMLRPRDDQ